MRGDHATAVSVALPAHNPTHTIAIMNTQAGGATPPIVEEGEAPAGTVTVGHTDRQTAAAVAQQWLLSAAASSVVIASTCAATDAVSIPPRPLQPVHPAPVQALLHSTTPTNAGNSSASIPSSRSGSPGSSPASGTYRALHLPNAAGDVDAKAPDSSPLSKGLLAEVIHQSAKVPPGEQQPQPQPRADSTSPPVKPRHCSNKSHPALMVVEDLRLAQQLVRHILYKQYCVKVAESGEKAIEVFREFMSQLRVVLMDIGLPGMDGVEATERIRALEAEAAAQAEAAGATPAAPVWIYGLTATVDPEDLARYQRAGMNGCILKGKLLADCVHRAVEESERNPGAFVNLATKFHE